MFILLSMFCIALIGCGGGGGGSGSSSNPTPNLQVTPSDYDFGIVTGTNSAKTLEVTLQNTGTASLAVSNITLSDESNFSLNLKAGANPCNSGAPLIAAAGSCTATVDFTPTTSGDFSAELAIRSNDPDTPLYNMNLKGKKQDVTAVNLRINQLDACPRSDATAYVSVMDQGGFPVNGLNGTNFTVMESVGGTPTGTTIATATQISDTVPVPTISVAILMDYSESIASDQLNVTTMQNAVSSFVKQLGAGDEAEIIKYATQIEVAQAFTSDQTSLLDAIAATPNVGTHTALYDAVVKAVDDISPIQTDRKAIIVITDGKDDNGTGQPQSQNTLTQVIDDANAGGIPVFTVGIASADATVLQPMADNTGGIYSDSQTTSNLGTISQQLADLFFKDQYVLKYASSLADAETGELKVVVAYTPTSTTFTGYDTKSIPQCSP